MIGNIINAVVDVIALLGALIIDVEAPGNGAAQKLQVLDRMSALADDIPIPGFLKGILLNVALLGKFVDMIVADLNATGFFTHSTPPAAGG